MEINCIAIDDEPLALKLIADYVSRIPSLKLLKTFEDALSAAEFLNHRPADLLLLDIDMPDISGLDLVKGLHEKPMVIFTTAHKQYAHEGFELEAVDYLLKPFPFERFERAIRKAVAHRTYSGMAGEEKENDAIYVYASYKLVKIPLDSIEYIEGMEDYIRIYLTDSSVVMTLLSLKKIMSRLPESRFMRIHRSYIVALGKVRYFSKKKLFLTEEAIPVGDSFATELRRKLQH